MGGCVSKRTLNNTDTIIRSSQDNRAQNSQNNQTNNNVILLFICREKVT
jgi:hypothetical protein